jgi:hypothetical protein
VGLLSADCKLCARVAMFKGSLLRGLQKLRVRHQSAGPDFSLFYWLESGLRL